MRERRRKATEQVTPTRILGRVTRLKVGCAGLVRCVVFFGPLSSFVENPATVRPGESVEVMVHPGHPGYTEETELLYSDWWEEMPFQVTFISYLAL